MLDEADEGQSSEIFTELLDIFCDQVSKLPGMFRIFLTSRPKREFDEIQSQHDHVRLRSIDIHTPENMNDIEIYMQLKLKEILRWGNLGEN